MKLIAKENRPQKICVSCGRSFSWRKKWKTNWPEVRYCTQRCRNTRLKNTAESKTTQNSRT